jgi:hypothetical protein
MATRIQLRRDTGANWDSANPVLAQGEIGLNLDDGSIKIGDGLTAWGALSYSNLALEISEIDGVQIVDPQNGDFLRYSSSASAWINDPVNLSTDTVGDYVESLVAGTGVTLENNSGEAAKPTISIGQDVSSSASVTFSVVTADIFGNVTGNADTASSLQSSRIIELSGDVSGSASFDGSANINISVTSNADSIELGTDTTGNYVVDVIGGTGVTVTHTQGEGSSASVAIGQDVSTSSSVTFSHVTADLLGNVVGDVAGNADTATALETARTISVDGDLSGSVSFDGTSDVTINAYVQPDSVALGTDTTGNYVNDVTASTGVTVSHTPGEGSSPVIAIGQDVSTTASVTFSHVTADVTGDLLGNVTGNVTGDLTGNADTASTLETARIISLAGDLSGSVSFDGGSNVSITATVQPDSVALGTDTTGNYVSDVTASTGVTISHTPGEGSSPTIAIGQNVATTASVTFAQVTADVTGDLTGNANTATALETTRSINLSGDLSGSVSFDGTSDVTITATVQPDSVALGTDTTGDYVQNLVAGTNVSLANNSGEGATPTVTVSGDLSSIDSISTPDYIQFDPTHIVTSASAGRLQWSADEGTLEIGLEGEVVNLPIGAKNVIYVKNGTGSTINRGKSIMAVGAAGDRISIALAVANGSIDSRYMLGIAAEDIADDSFGYVVTNGYIRNINTSAWPVGTILYFDPQTPGGITTTEPDAPNLLLPIAIVVKQNASSGIIYVRMTLGAYLRESHDVSISTPVSGDFLKYNGSVWVNDAINLGTDTEGNYLVDVVGGTGVIVTHTPGEGSSASIEIGQDVGTSASVSFAQVQTTGDVVIGGDLTVNGNTTTLNTETLVVEDNIIVLNGNVTGSPVSDAGIEIERGTSPNVALRWNETSDSWEITEDGTTYKDIAVGQDVETSSSVTFAHVSSDVTGDLTGNADTATALETARTISLAGDLSGSVSFDGGSDVTITATVEPDSVALGTDTTGNYVSDVTASTGVTISHTPGEGSSPTISIGQSVETTASVTFAHVTADVTGDLTGNADTATALETARAVILAGDLSGSVSFDGTSNVTITATVQPDSVALGTDTTGNYVSDVVAGTGVTITHTPGEGSSASVAIGQSVGTSSSVTFAAVTTGALVGGQDSVTNPGGSGAVTVATFDKTVYRTAEFILQVSSDSKYTSQKVLVVHDGTNVTHTRYGIVEIGSPPLPLVVTSDISDNDVRLRVAITGLGSEGASIRVFQTEVLV